MPYGLPLTLTTELRGDRPVYRLDTSITYPFTTVPAGFLTDLVSAPRWARRVLPLAKMAHAAILHDFLCNRRRDLKYGHCNAIFRRQMKQDGVSFYWRWVVWLYLSRPGAPRINHPQPYLDERLPDPGAPAPLYLTEQHP